MLNITQLVEAHAQVPIHMVQKGKATTTKRLPFFFLHGDWSGSVPFYCYTIARLIGTVQPFYAVDTYKCNGSDAPQSLEEIAMTHAQSIRSVQPEGPYLLGGFCSGAYLAYEIAQQLEAQGQKVELLALVSPAEISSSHICVRRMLNKIGFLLHVSSRRQLNMFVYLRHFIRSIYRRILATDNPKIFDLDKLLEMEPKLNKVLPPVDALYQDFPGVFTYLAAGYIPKRPVAQAAFIWAEANLAYRSQWSIVERGRPSVVLPGYYMTLLNENVETFAAQLKLYIDEAQQRVMVPAVLAQVKS